MKERIKADARRLLARAKKEVLKRWVGNRWQPSGEEIHRRVYTTYGQYLAHQRNKLDTFSPRAIEVQDARLHAALRTRLKGLPIVVKGFSVLCLGARRGGEVRAFIEEGAFAVGVDLNPGAGNPYVVVGDFHGLQYASGSVDVVYTNSLDHTYDLDALLAEIARVLRTEGLLVAEVGLGQDEGGGPQFFESLAWSTVDAVAESIVRAGFVLVQRQRFTTPWRGIQLVLVKRDGSAS